MISNRVVDFVSRHSVRTVISPFSDRMHSNWFLERRSLTESLTTLCWSKTEVPPHDLLWWQLHSDKLTFTFIIPKVHLIINWSGRAINYRLNRGNSTVNSGHMSKFLRYKHWTTWYYSWTPDIAGFRFHPITGREDLLGRIEVQLYSFSWTSALDGGGWSTPRPGRNARYCRFLIWIILPNSTSITKSRRIRFVGHMSCTGR